MRAMPMNTPVRSASNRSASAKSVFNNAHARSAGDAGAQPVLRVRTMFIGLCVLIVCIAGPLGLVWKQSYINQASIQLESSAQTLKALNMEIKSLNLMCNRLAAPERVERIARSQGFEYPASRQLEVLEVGIPRQERGLGGFLSRAMQSFPGKN